MKKSKMIGIIAIVALFAASSAYSASAYKTLAYCLSNFVEIFVSGIALAAVIYFIGYVRTRTKNNPLQGSLLDASCIATLFAWGYCLGRLVYVVGDNKAFLHKEYWYVSIVAIIACWTISFLSRKFWKTPKNE